MNTIHKLRQQIISTRNAAVSPVRAATFNEVLELLDPCEREMRNLEYRLSAAMGAAASGIESVERQRRALPVGHPHRERLSGRREALVEVAEWLGGVPRWQRTTPEFMMRVSGSEVYWLISKDYGFPLRGKWDSVEASWEVHEHLRLASDRVTYAMLDSPPPMPEAPKPSILDERMVKP